MFVATARAVLLAAKPSSDYKPSSFFERVRIAWKEEEEERAKKAAEAKEAVKDGVGKDGAKGKKRKRGHAKGKAEDLDESTLQRKVLIRRYKKHSVPKETTELMVRFPLLMRGAMGLVVIYQLPLGM